MPNDAISCTTNHVPRKLHNCMFLAVTARSCEDRGVRIRQPHTAKKNEKHWATQGKKKGFDIRVVTQPAQSPDLNVNDLAFFASLQSDTELVAKENVTDLVEAVTACWENYPIERMESVWRCLYGSFKGIVETRGDNNYSHHTGSRSKHAKSDREGDRHDRMFDISAIKDAEMQCEK